MKFIKIISVLVLSFFLLSYSAHGSTAVDSKTQIVFSKFITKVEKKYTAGDKITFLELLNKKIVFIGEKRVLTDGQKKLLDDLLVLSNEEIFETQTSSYKDNFSQKILESSYVKDLKDIVNGITIPEYVKKLESSERIVRKIGQNYEYVENNTVKKLSFRKYSTINSQNYRLFFGESGHIVITLEGETWFVKSAEILQKIPYSQAFRYTKGFITHSHKFFESANNYYSYNFKNFKFLEDRYGFYIDDLASIGIEIGDSVLYLGENNRFNFLTNYTSVKLIGKDIIFGVSDKKKFLEHLVNDKLHLTGDTDSLFIKLKTEIEELTMELNQAEKIQTLYNWTLDNLEYTQNLNIADKKIFSGILSYQNNDGVCEGYAKLYSYALMFAGVSGSDVLRGDVIDAQDFPQIGHAWVKIGDSYYDPTFDDPIGSKKTKEFGEYKFFKLPRDLLYANRFDYGTTPEILKIKSLEFRENFINKRLSLLADKYSSSNYMLLKGVTYNKSIGLEAGEKITLTKAKELLRYAEVKEKTNGELKVFIDGKNKNITKLQYYTVDDKNIDQIFEQNNYKMDGYYLFKWTDVNGRVEWRMGFNVIIK